MSSAKTKVKPRPQLVERRLRFEKNRAQRLNQRQEATLLAAGVAHEFNNILGALDGHAQFALESSNPHEVRAALQMVGEVCKRAFQITRSLQYFAQPQEEQFVEFKATDLQHDLMQLLPTTQSTHIKWNIQEGELIGGAHELGELLLNLIKNAFEAGATEVQVHSKLLKPESGQTQDQQQFYEFEVSDNGLGVAETHQELIFQPFFTTKGIMSHAAESQSQSSTQAQPGVSGSGLGLFLCRRIAEEHGGHLILTSPNTFTLRLPIF